MPGPGSPSSAGKPSWPRCAGLWSRPAGQPGPAGHRRCGHGQDHAPGRRGRPGPVGGPAGPARHRPGVGIEARVRRAAPAPAPSAVPRGGPAQRRQARGPAGGARPGRGPGASRSAPHLGCRAHPALGPGRERKRCSWSPTMPTGSTAARSTPCLRSSRLDAERVVLLLGARGAVPPAGFDRGFPELHLEPLSAADAGRLLDGQASPAARTGPRAGARPGGRAIHWLLIELAKVIADDPAASGGGRAVPLLRTG